MTIHSIVIQKLLSTNAHLGRRVAAHHFKVYICGSRNGIAILDSDKTLIRLRNACHFIGSLIRQKGRFFFSLRLLRRWAGGSSDRRTDRRAKR